jgi:hypothetical protein
MYFGEFLVEHSNGLITEGLINKALSIQKNDGSGKRIGQVLVDMKLLTHEELREYLLRYQKAEQQAVLKEMAHDKINSEKKHPDADTKENQEKEPVRFGEFIVQHSKGKVTDEHISIALNLQKTEHVDKKIGGILVEMGIITREEMGMFLVSYSKYKRTLFISSMHDEGLLSE